MSSNFCAAAVLCLLLATGSANKLRNDRSAESGVQVAVGDAVSYSGNPTLKKDCGETGDESVYPTNADECYSKSDVLAMPSEVAEKAYASAIDACNACKFTAIASCSEYCRCTCYASPQLNLDGSSVQGFMFECVDAGAGLTATAQYSQCQYGSGSVDKFGETFLPPAGNSACHQSNRANITTAGVNSSTC